MERNCHQNPSKEKNYVRGVTVRVAFVIRAELSGWQLSDSRKKAPCIRLKESVHFSRNSYACISPVSKVDLTVSFKRNSCM